MAIVSARKQKWASVLDRRLRREPGEQSYWARPSRPIFSNTTKLSNKKACQRSAFSLAGIWSKKFFECINERHFSMAKKRKAVSSFWQLARKIGREGHLQKNSKGSQLVVLVVNKRILTEIKDDQKCNFANISSNIYPVHLGNQ